MLHGRKTRVIILAVAVSMAISMLAPLASFAGATGRRNTAIGVTGAAAYLLLKHKTGPGLVAAGGAAYAWNRYNHEKKAEKSRARRSYYSGNSRGRGPSYGRSRYSHRRYHAKRYRKCHHKCCR